MLRRIVPRGRNIEPKVLRNMSDEQDMIIGTPFLCGSTRAELIDDLNDSATEPEMVQMKQN